MKIEYLYEFLDLVETMNYSLSASRLYISQPTLSRHIQAMEKELGFPLFHTSSHAYRCTADGSSQDGRGLGSVQAYRLLDVPTADSGERPTKTTK